MDTSVVFTSKMTAAYMYIPPIYFLWQENGKQIRNNISLQDVDQPHDMNWNTIHKSRITSEDD